jgi:hypothetical protein
MSTTVTINRAGVGLDEIAEAVRTELGQEYTIEQSGKPDSFVVKGGFLTTASVEVRQAGARTTVVVKGGGGILIAQRLRNERGIAQQVAGAIERHC